MVDVGSDAALLVVDVQQGFDDPSWGPRNNPEAESNISLVLGRWRETGRPVFHVFHDSASPRSPLRPHADGNAPKPEAKPRAGEGVHRKTVNSAFIGTGLEADLRRAGISTLVVVGLTTNHCVSTTVRMAGNFGFQVYLLSDATATFDRVGLDGQNRPAAEVHAAALSDLDGEFATVINTSELLSQRR